MELKLLKDSDDGCEDRVWRGGDGVFFGSVTTSAEVAGLLMGGNGRVGLSLHNADGVLVPWSPPASGQVAAGDRSTINPVLGLRSATGPCSPFLILSLRPISWITPVSFCTAGHVSA